MRIKGLFGLSMLWILSAAILATIYLAWIFYPLEISWLGLEKVVHLPATTISRNFEVLMDYLTNPVDWTLKMPNFPSSQNGLHHFQMVKYLFHVTQAIFIVTLPAFVHFCRTIIAKKYLHLFRHGLLFLICLPLLFGGMAFLVGFDQFFILFHKILFAGDSTWLFDPAVDPVIWILPENFFMHTFILFFLLFEGTLAGLYIVSWLEISRQKK
ncbi:TIGR01906 family membrane protein [Streptococcus massiliensis]|uniref:Hypothetical membrane protein n=1 Tax=Streptococcus massiliensis TaxID=313439 RepID=A0A380KY29_9STRE|nr:TIGR01906 family membrane protein [Streptococcus massiliensis]SUN75846.1 hypothetical membrane protein [Streptococcus massiliensis]